MLYSWVMVIQTFLIRYFLFQKMLSPTYEKADFVTNSNAEGAVFGMYAFKDKFLMMIKQHLLFLV